MHIKFLFSLLAVLMLVVLGANETEADCLSIRYRGPCTDSELCGRVCKGEGRGRVSGYCTTRLKCRCEGC